MNTIEKSYSAKWGLGRCLAVLATVIVIATTAVWYMNVLNDDTTGTISKAELPTAQYGTPAHPYADASQCPASTDVVFWPRSDRLVPSIPSGISVCFVETESFNNTGLGLQGRDH
jgi:hypothetical protein